MQIVIAPGWRLPLLLPHQVKGETIPYHWTLVACVWTVIGDQCENKIVNQCSGAQPNQWEFCHKLLKPVLDVN